MIKIDCDFCKKEIPSGILYGRLNMPLLAEVNFCGIGCFDDWVKLIYMKKL